MPVRSSTAAVAQAHVACEQLKHYAGEKEFGVKHSYIMVKDGTDGEGVGDDSDDGEGGDGEGGDGEGVGGEGAMCSR
jgi:hypothetical protein